jgi:hypothetical protein
MGTPHVIVTFEQKEDIGLWIWKRFFGSVDSVSIVMKFKMLVR